VAATDGKELDLRRYVVAVRRRWPVIAITVGVLVALALALSLLQSKVYEGEARVVVQPRSNDAVFSAQTGPSLDPELALETEIQVLKSTTVRAAVRRQLGPVPKVSASRVGQTLVVAVRARSGEPARAATITNAYARTYIKLRRQQAVDDLLAAGTEIQRKVSESQRQIAAVQQDLTTAVPATRPALESRLEALIGQQALFQQRLDEVQVQAALKTGGLQLVATATRPTEPVAPTPVRNAILALVMGLMLGLSLAAVLEYFDESVKTQSDLETAAGGLPVLGLIPLVDEWRRGGPHPRSLTTTGSTSPVAEAYRSLRTSVQLLGVERPLRVVQVTSPNSGEGKTTTISSLAVVMAHLGHRVVIVDGDMRRARVHELFGAANAVGLSSVLAGTASVDDALASVAGVENLWVLPAGPVPANPSELLANQRTAETLFALQSQFTTVLIDSPPVLPVTDATVLAAWVDATILVTSAGTTTMRHVRAAIDRLRRVDAPLVGTVLNRARYEAAEYGYAYGYGPDATSESRGKAPAT
jgi:succinoglycan biosynthesis transport protein ExoP